MANIQGLLDKYKQIPDERFFKDVFENKEYQSIASKKASCVIDVGALAGEFSAYIYPQAEQIYAIEPYEPYYKELEENIREFGLEKIKPYQLAISDTNGTGLLTVNTSRGGNSLSETAGDVVNVPTKTLAQFIKDEHIEHVDILKIDIEAHEQKVFCSEDFKDVAYRIECIIGEHVDGGVIKALEGFGFTMRPEGVNYIFER